MAKIIAMENFDTILERIKEVTAATSLRQLAEIIGVKHQTISAAKKKNEFSAGWAFIIAQKYKVSTDWIMTGKGPKERSEDVPFNPLLIEVNKWLNETKKQEDAEFRILFRQQMIRAFFDYEKWIIERKVSLGSGEDFPARKIA